MGWHAGHEQQLPLGALLMCCAPALLLLLNRQWWLLLQLLLLLGPTLALLAPAFPQQLLASLRSHMPGQPLLQQQQISWLSSTSAI